MDINEGKLSNEAIYPKEDLKVSASRKEDEQEKEFDSETSEEESSAELDDVLEKKEIGDDIESAPTNQDAAFEEVILIGQWLYPDIPIEYLLLTVLKVHS